MSLSTVRIGVCGLGRAFTLTAPAFADPRVRLVAAAEPRASARERFEVEFGGRAYQNVDGLSRDPAVDLVYVASPHTLHARHALAAIDAGKHVLVEKPMALSLAECDAMILAARRAGVRLLVGPSHGFDEPIALAARLIAGGEFGAPRMITALNYTDFLYRPRHAEELDTARGGGVLLNQAPHQVDVVRRLAGGAAPRSVRATAGAWDPARKVEGAYTAHLSFDTGLVASLTYSGYGHFDSDALQDWVGETGSRKNPDDHGRARRALAASADEERRQRLARAYGETAAPAAHAKMFLHEHFGFVVVSCEHADLRPTSAGVDVYGDLHHRFHELAPPRIPRSEVIDEICRAVGGGGSTFSGEWGRDTLKVCLAIGISSREGREIAITGRTPPRPEEI